MLCPLILYVSGMTYSLTWTLQMEIDFGLRISHKTIRYVLEKHKYISRVARKKPVLSAQNVEKRLRFATKHVSLSPEYWDDVIFLDEMKIMLCYHDGSQRVWRKPLTALENKNLIPPDIQIREKCVQSIADIVLKRNKGVISYLKFF